MPASYIEGVPAPESAFGLEIGAVDYQVEADGTPHLLELNHIPSVTCFEEVRTAYLDLAAAWIAAS